MKRTIGWLDSVGRIGEKEQPIGPGDNVVRTIQPLARPGFRHGPDVAAIGTHPRNPPPSLLAKDDPAPFCERLAICRSGPLAQDPDRPIRPQPIGALSLDVLEQERTVRAPEGTFRELKSVSQQLDGLTLDELGKPGISENSHHGEEPPRIRLSLYRRQRTYQI